MIQNIFYVYIINMHKKKGGFLDFTSKPESLLEKDMTKLKTSIGNIYRNDKLCEEKKNQTQCMNVDECIWSPLDECIFNKNILTDYFNIICNLLHRSIYVSDDKNKYRNDLILLAQRVGLRPEKTFGVVGTSKTWKDYDFDSMCELLSQKLGLEFIKSSENIDRLKGDVYAIGKKYNIDIDALLKYAYQNRDLNKVELYNKLRNRIKSSIPYIKLTMIILLVIALIVMPMLGVIGMYKNKNKGLRSDLEVFETSDKDLDFKEVYSPVSPTIMPTTFKKTISNLSNIERIRLGKKREFNDEYGDVCKESPKICEGNLNIPRKDMPQLDIDEMDKFFSDIHDKNIKDRNGFYVTMTKKNNISVDDIYPTQNEISLKKSQQIKDSLIKGLSKIGKHYLGNISPENINKKDIVNLYDKIDGMKELGKWEKQTIKDFIDGEFIISKDEYLLDDTTRDDYEYNPSTRKRFKILDGHHRWLAAKILSDDYKDWRNFKAMIIEVPMSDLIQIADKYSKAKMVLGE